MRDIIAKTCEIKKTLFGNRAYIRDISYRVIGWTYTKIYTDGVIRCKVYAEERDGAIYTPSVEKLFSFEKQ